MKYFLIISILICVFCFISTQCPNKASSLSSFTPASFAGTWFVYQRSYSDDPNDLNRKGLCDHIEAVVDSTAININYTVFSLKEQIFKSNISKYTYDSNNPGVLIQVINPSGTTDDKTLLGDPVFQIIDTDYKSYAIVWYCQTLQYNTDSKQYLMFLLRSLTNIESTVLPIIYNIFQKVNNLNGYDGDLFELVYHYIGVCKGL